MIITLKLLKENKQELAIHVQLKMQSYIFVDS